MFYQIHKYIPVLITSHKWAMLRENLTKAYEHSLLDEKSVVERCRCHIASQFGIFADEDHSKLLTLYWFPKLHKRPYIKVTFYC